MIKNIIGFLYELLQIWKESLKLLINRQFWLVTFKASIETYQLLFRKFWWLIFTCFFVDIGVRTGFFWLKLRYLLHFLEKNNQITIVLPGHLITKGVPVIMVITWFLLWCMLGLVIFLIVRSSLDQKKQNYFSQKIKNYYVYFVITTLALWVVYDEIRHFFVISGKNFFFWTVFFTSPLLEIKLSTFYASPFLIVYTFFYLDTVKSILNFIRRLWSAFLLLFYTYPFCFITGFGIMLLMGYTGKIVRGLVAMTIDPLFVNITTSSFSEIFADDVTKLFLPFFFCLINNLYTKQVHDHYDLYT